MRGGFSPSPCVGTNGFAEDVNPFPTELLSHLDVASDMTSPHIALLSFIAYSQRRGARITASTLPSQLLKDGQLQKMDLSAPPPDLVGK